MSAKDGGSAFPRFFPESKTREGKITRPRDEQPGMTLRDYFAGHVAQGLLASESNATLANARREVARRNLVDYTEQFAIEAYSIADAMIAERAK